MPDLFPVNAGSTFSPTMSACVELQDGPKSKPPPIFQKIVLKIANEIRFLRKVKV